MILYYYKNVMMILVIIYKICFLRYKTYIDVIGYVKTDKKRYSNDAEKQGNSNED